MAGSYPDVPDHRMAYDRDGTVGVDLDSSATYRANLTTSQMQKVNNEATDYIQLSQDGSYITFVFPELRDITGVIVNTADIGGYELQATQTSTDTTTGDDGTWTTRTLGYTRASSKANLRNNITAVSWSGVKAVRFKGWYSGGASSTSGWQNIHLFGSPSSSQDRLKFLDPSTALEVGGAYFDLGDVARGSTTSVDFQVHNPSTTLTANSVTVTMEALTDTSPSNTGQFEFSTDGGSTWASSASLGNLSPGGTSTTVTVRRVTSTSAALGLWWTRMIASASSWS